MHRHRNVAARMGAWSARHRRAAILGWIGFVVLAIGAGGSVGQRTLDPIDTENGDSYLADQAIDAAGFEKAAGEQVLVQGRGDIRFGDPAFVAGVDDVVGGLRRTPHVQKVKSPLDAENRGQLARDGRSALVTFEVEGDRDLALERVAATLDATAAAQRAHPGLRIEQFGGASAEQALTRSFEDDLARAETRSLPLTIVVLLLAFGALVAAGIPLLLGFSAVVATIGLIGPVSQIWPVDSSIGSVVFLVGLAVGIDYSLFYVRREMEERDAGRPPDEALAIAAATSGRAVLISGATVMAAMAGMFLAGNKVFTSFAIGTILVVAVAMVGSVTVLPAALSKLGDRVERGRLPVIGKLRHRRHEARAWCAILALVLRRPAVSALLATALLVVLALPLLHMHTANAGFQGLPRSLPIMQTYDRILAAFPGGPLPAVVVVQADDVDSTAVRRGIAELRTGAVATGRLSEPTTVDVNPRHDLAIVSIPIKGTGTDERSEVGLATLRDEVIPGTIGRVDGVEVHITGMTAGSKDFNDTMKSRLPFVFAFVLTLAFAILLVTFRSVVVPIKAILLNLLSVGAAYGVLTWVFQDGHLEGVLGFESIGSISSWLPLFLFVLLFGLSMDYHVFILSRVRELVDRGRSTEEAVTSGIRGTAGVVTSAAAVMIAVFAVFATLSGLELKQMGVGLAVAVLLDATIVRAVLLPATMRLLGEWNWYLPAWLEWLPDVEREPAPAAALAADVEFGELRRGRATERL